MCASKLNQLVHKILAMGFTYVDQGQVMVAGKVELEKKKTNMVGNSN